MQHLRTDDELRQALQSAQKIAVLGAHPTVERPAHFVPTYLKEQGYDVIPVNARYSGQELFGAQVVGSLTEIGAEVDIVDVFRRGEAVREHLQEILNMSPRPRIVWMQKGVQNEEVADLLVAEGIQVVQDACTMEKHRELL